MPAKVKGVDKTSGFFPMGSRALQEVLDLQEKGWRVASVHCNVTIMQRTWVLPNEPQRLVFVWHLDGSRWVMENGVRVAENPGSENC